MRKLLVAVGAIAGLMLATGCKNERQKLEDERADLAEKRQEVGKELSEIRQDMAKETAEVRQDAAEKTAEVRQDAQKEMADKREELAEERRDVNEAQRDLAQAKVDDATTGGTVTGTLKSTTGGLTIRDDKGLDYELETNDATTVTYDGQRVKLDDFKEGSEVRASYSVHGDDKVAKDVEILKNAFEASPKNE